MTGPAFLLLAFAVVAAVGNWLAVAHRNKPVEYLTKPLATALLVGVALALDPREPSMRAWFVAALVLSLLGDVALMVPRELFVFGLGAFLLGHVAYVAGMHVDGVDGTRFLVGVALAAVAMAVVGTVVLRSVRAGGDPGLAGPVVAYMVVISAMVASAIGVGRPVMVLGAASFYVSDALIAWNRFVRALSWAPVAIMVTYHLAQVCLVLSLA